MELKSFAKINLGLKVHGRMADGYHLLSTVFQTISLHDTIRFESDSDLVIECDDPAVPTDRGNLMFRAALKLRERFGVSDGARMILTKRIPSPGGLGGGSSNAAVALMGLSKMWGLRPSGVDLLSLASELGADVPFFLLGGTAKGCRRGDEVIPLDDSPLGSLLVMTPSFGIPTVEAFRALQSPCLTSDEVQSILRVCHGETDIASGNRLRGNDFEAWAFERYGELSRMAEVLRREGATSVSLSGSGSSIFAIFEKEETRQATIEALAECQWRMFAVATVTRSEFRDALSECEGLFPISF